MVRLIDDRSLARRLRSALVATAFAWALPAAGAHAQVAADFDCDFDEVMEGFSGDGSCDYSVDVDGSFDVSCDFSHDDDATDTSVSGDFDASCDLDENGLFECDYSSSYDFDSPKTSVSSSFSCDTLGSGEVLHIDCGGEEVRREIRELLEKIEVTCGIPQDFQSILDKVLGAGDDETALLLLSEMRHSMKTVRGLDDKRKIKRRLKKARNLVRKGRTEKAQALVATAQRMAQEGALGLPIEERDKLCASSLYCFVQ